MEMEAAILAGLLRRGLQPHVAQGIVANMIAESRLDPGINEIAPLVPGSRGGFGLNQWTGPRRREFEAFAQQRGVPLNDLDTQLDFTMHELQGPERRAFTALQGAPDAISAARIYSDKFLRPGIPHMDRRLSEAARLSGQPLPAAGTGQSQAPQRPQEAPSLAGLFGGDAAPSLLPQPAAQPQRRGPDPREEQTRRRRQAFFGAGGLADTFGAG